MHDYLLSPFTALALTVASHAATSLVIPNPDFEEGGLTLDGDGDSIPIAQDPGDIYYPGPPGYHGGHLVNPASTRLGSAHSGSLVLWFSDDSPTSFSLYDQAGGFLGLSPGDAVTLSGWYNSNLQFDNDSAGTPAFRAGLTVVGASGVDYHSDDMPAGVVSLLPEWQYFSLTIPYAPPAGFTPTPGGVEMNFWSHGEMLLDDLSATLSPVPEPSTALLILPVVVWLCGRRHRP
ncbi:MAG: hypothetical protein ACKV19_07395 [Verrucomicrobiales bacterium]